MSGLTKTLSAGCSVVIISLSFVGFFRGYFIDPSAHLFILSGQSNMERLDSDSYFLPLVASEFGRENVIVVKDAHGGQPIRQWYKGWRPSAGESLGVNGSLYNTLIEKVKKSIGTKSITFVWMQGV